MGIPKQRCLPPLHDVCVWLYVSLYAPHGKTQYMTVFTFWLNWEIWHTHTHTHTRTRTHTHTRAHTHPHTPMSILTIRGQSGLTHTHTYTHTTPHTHARAHTHTHAHTLVNTNHPRPKRLNTHTRAHTHTHIHVNGVNRGGCKCTMQPRRFTCTCRYIDRKSSFNVSLNLHYKLQRVTILIWKNILDSK